METTHGFDIPKRELTEEESNRLITLERFNEFRYKAGEDFIDTCSILIPSLKFVAVVINELNLIWPSICSKILSKAGASKYFEVRDIKHILDNDELTYLLLSKCLNTAPSYLKEVNQVLIQVPEYYND